MLAYLRYALATICFALSVGCLALWWRSTTQRDIFNGPSFVLPNQELGIAASHGLGMANLGASGAASSQRWQHSNSTINESERKFKESFIAKHGHFIFLEYGGGTAIYFPLWYPALVCALAGIGACRLGRRFTLRSAIIATTVVAGLLGIVVAL